MSVTYGVIEMFGEDEFFHPLASLERAKKAVHWSPELTLAARDDKTGEFYPVEEVREGATVRVEA